MLLWNPVPIPVFDPGTGAQAGGAKAYFYVGGTTTPLAVFTTDDGAAPHAWPVVADANGVFPPIFIPYGPFGFRITTDAGTIISPNILTVQNPAPPASGGGGGIVVQADQILTPGDTMWRLQGGVRSGWVRMNDRTIGNTGSGATERANADTEAVYTFLWDNCADSVAPVSGGRGSTAAADFAANKTITVPTMQGIIAGGVDDMGGTATNRIQRSTTISTTNGSPTATVASAAGLVIGMTVVSANVQAGTVINDISGTTLTLSANATATAGGVDARFSMFSDAQVIGALGGSAQRALRVKEVPIITPAGSVSGTSSFYAQPTLVVGSTAPPQANNYALGPLSVTTAGITASFTGTPFGGGLNSPLVQPTRLGTWYMKV